MLNLVNTSVGNSLSVDLVLYHALNLTAVKRALGCRSVYGGLHHKAPARGR